jgi:phage-related minor tail protein
MANQILARLGVVMTLNAAEWEDEVNKAIAAEKKLKREITKQNSDIEKEILKLTYAVKDYGKEVTLVEKLEREFASGGKFQQATQSRKDALLSQAAAMDALTAASKKSQQETIKAAGLTTYQLQALSYQTTDIVTSLAGGQNPMLVLLQQGGQLRDQFGGITNVFKAFAQVLTVTRVVVGGLAAAFGTLAYAAYKGNEEFKEFNNSLILSGNTAALTYDKFKGLSQTLAGGGMVGLRDAKEIFASLAASGQFTSKSIESVAKSISLVSRLSGQSVDVVGKDLIAAFNGTASSAKNLNEKYNFLTLAQYRQIEALERAGDKQSAINTLSQALNEKLEKQAPQLGTIAKLWNSIADVFERIKNIGVPDSDEQRLEFLASRVSFYQKMAAKFPEADARAKQLKDATDAYDKLYEKISNKRKQLDEEAKRAEEERRKIEIATPLEQLIEKRYQLEKTKNEGLHNQRLENAQGLARIEIEAEKKTADAILEYQKKNEKERSQNILANENQLVAELNNIEQEKIQKRNQMQFEAAKTVEDKIRAQELEVAQAEKLQELYKQNVMVSADQVEISKSRLALAKFIADIERNLLITAERKKELIDLATTVERKKEEVAAAEKLYQLAQQQTTAIRERQKSESDSIALEEQKLRLYQNNLFATQAELDIAMSRLKTEQEIASIREKMANNPKFREEGENLIAQQRIIQERREGIIELGERLKVLGDVNQAVFRNMESAIDNFVKTGKLSFKDLARSIIQDILAIYLKSQMLQMFRGLGGLFGSSGAATTAGGTPMIGDFGFSTGGVMTAADGGYISGPTLVGENGPELFIPRTAGTIVPNQQMAGMTGTPQVVYNGPYIANMQAIDTQSAAQFLARNKESVWAANQSASRSVPQSR